VVDFHRVMIAPSSGDDQFPDCRRFVANPQHAPPTPQAACSYTPSAGAWLSPLT
jgi:hypothetical protein